MIGYWKEKQCENEGSATERQNAALPCLVLTLHK